MEKRGFGARGLSFGLWTSCRILLIPWSSLGLDINTLRMRQVVKMTNHIRCRALKILRRTWNTQTHNMRQTSSRRWEDMKYMAFEKENRRVEYQIHHPCGREWRRWIIFFCVQAEIRSHFFTCTLWGLACSASKHICAYIGVLKSACGWHLYLKLVIDPSVLLHHRHSHGACVSTIHDATWWFDTIPEVQRVIRVSNWCLEAKSSLMNSVLNKWCVHKQLLQSVLNYTFCSKEAYFGGQGKRTCVWHTCLALRFGYLQLSQKLRSWLRASNMTHRSVQKNYFGY